MKAEFTATPRMVNSPLSPDQRMGRICELLSKAVVRDLASRIVVGPPATDPVHVGRSESSDGERILAYLALIGDASSTAIRETVGLTKIRAYRAIHPLVAAGRIVAEGHARATHYRLSQAEISKLSRN